MLNIKYIQSLIGNIQNNIFINKSNREIVNIITGI